MKSTAFDIALNQLTAAEEKLRKAEEEIVRLSEALDKANEMNALLQQSNDDHCRRLRTRIR